MFEFQHKSGPHKEKDLEPSAYSAMPDDAPRSAEGLDETAHFRLKGYLPFPFNPEEPSWLRDTHVPALRSIPGAVDVYYAEMYLGDDVPAGTEITTIMDGEASWSSYLHSELRTTLKADVAANRGMFGAALRPARRMPLLPVAN